MAGIPSPNAPNASEALYGFAAWLSTRDGYVKVGANCDAAEIAELVNEYCNVQGFPPTREGVFPNNLKTMREQPVGEMRRAAERFVGPGGIAGVEGTHAPGDQGANQSGGPRLDLGVKADDYVDVTARADESPFSAVEYQAAQAFALCEHLKNQDKKAVDPRWLATARTDFQKAFMALRRSLFPNRAERF